MLRAVVLGAIALLLLTTYVVRETVAAELLFSLLFLAVLILVVTCYGLGTVMEKLWSIARWFGVN